MLAKEFKLKSSEAIKATMKQGQRSRGPFLSVFFQPKSEGNFQAAVVLGKKVAGTAVRRNRIRRLIFAALADRLKAQEAKLFGNMVVLVASIPTDEKLLTPELEKCLKELSLA